VIDTEQLLQDLTEPQRQAVMHVDGPLVIIAGAGSGRTRVLTRRVAYLASLGIPANSILAITFTNKAAGEMKQRVSNVLDRPIRDFGKLDQRWPTICTFHSLCLRVLRHYAEAIGLPRRRILRHELLPNVVAPLMVEIGLRLTFSIGLIASLDYLGLGVQPPAPDWGLIIQENQSGLSVTYWPVLVPVVAIALLTIGTNLVTDGVARAVGGIDRRLES